MNLFTLFNLSQLYFCTESYYRYSQLNCLLPCYCTTQLKVIKVQHNYLLNCRENCGSCKFKYILSNDIYDRPIPPFPDKTKEPLTRAFFPNQFYVSLSNSKFINQIFVQEHLFLIFNSFLVIHGSHNYFHTMHEVYMFIIL